MSRRDWHWTTNQDQLRVKHAESSESIYIIDPKHPIQYNYSAINTIRKPPIPFPDFWHRVATNRNVPRGEFILTEETDENNKCVCIYYDPIDMPNSVEIETTFAKDQTFYSSSLRVSMQSFQCLAKDVVQFLESRDEYMTQQYSDEYWAWTFSQLGYERVWFPPTSVYSSDSNIPTKQE